MAVDFSDLLRAKGFDPQHVVVLRHRPPEAALNKVLPWLAAEKPAVFNAHQQTQRGNLEKVMAALVGGGHVASFIGHQPRKALFVGLYAITGSRPLTYHQFWQIPAHVELRALGMHGFRKDDPPRRILWFDLEPTEFYTAWHGKLIVGWPPPERSWWRRAHMNDFPVLAVLEDSALDTAMPGWDELTLTWEELRVLPTRWRSALSQWRGIYYIFDTAVGKGYVGSAYGKDNLLGRWLGYAARGHGGNKLLRQRDPGTFRFTILQRVSPDMEAGDLIRLERSWKERLHTRDPFGLNEN